MIRKLLGTAVLALGLTLAGCGQDITDATTGTLDVVIKDLPTGIDANVTLAGPKNFSENLKTSKMFKNAELGEYAYTAKNVTTTAGAEYAPTTGTEKVTLGAKETKKLTIVYNKVLKGNLTVTVTGLPTGVNANVKVTGVSFTKDVPATETLKNLKPGEYTVAATSVVNGDDLYVATVNPTTVTVVDGQTGVADVTYTKTLVGKLNVTISGLPSGASPNVTVTGPSSFNQTLSATTLLDRLPVGSYVLAAEDLRVGANYYVASIDVPAPTVIDAQTTNVTVSYAVTAPSSSLTVTINGLPQGQNAKVNVTGPNNFSQMLTQTTTINGLDAGTYTIKSQEVDSSNFISNNLVYLPKIPTVTATTNRTTSGSTVIEYGEEFSYASFNTSFADQNASNLKQKVVYTSPNAEPAGYVYTYTSKDASTASFTRDSELATITYALENQASSYYGFDMRPFVTRDYSSYVPKDLSGYTKMRIKLRSIKDVTSITIIMMSKPDDDLNYLDAQFIVDPVPSTLTEYILDLNQFKPIKNDKNQTGLTITEVLKELRQIRVQAGQAAGTYQVSGINLIK
jgi:hypothetical protein